MSTDRLLAVFVDRTGGALDVIAADADVTTFLNDRFDPWFLAPGAASALPTAPSAWFMDRQGCMLDQPWRPESPEAWIDAANTAIASPTPAPPPVQAAFMPSAWTFDLPAKHPLRGNCPRSP